MLKKIIIGAVVVAAVLGAALLIDKKEAVAPAADEQAVRAAVIEFSERLKNKTPYNDLISADLLASFATHPISTPGQIDIIEIAPTDDGAYEVQAKMLRSSIALKLRNREGRWMITGFQEASPAN